MLTMNCPNCNTNVSSEILADVSTIECDHCKENIEIKDVFITTPHFTINREDFFKQTKRYKRILEDVENELLSLANDKGATPKRIKDLEQFHLSLHELLDGARGSYRLEIPTNFYVEVSDQNGILRGRLLNLSADGCSIELLMLDTLPRINTVLRIEFFFPELTDFLVTRSRVVWANEPLENNGLKRAIIGTSFLDMGEAARQSILDYIINNAPIPFQQVSR